MPSWSQLQWFPARPAVAPGDLRGSARCWAESSEACQPWHSQTRATACGSDETAHALLTSAFLLAGRRSSRRCGFPEGVATPGLCSCSHCVAASQALAPSACSGLHKLQRCGAQHLAHTRPPRIRWYISSAHTAFVQEGYRFRCCVFQLQCQPEACGLQLGAHKSHNLSHPSMRPCCCGTLRDPPGSLSASWRRHSRSERC